MPTSSVEKKEASEWVSASYWGGTSWKRFYWEFRLTPKDELPNQPIPSDPMPPCSSNLFHTHWTFDIAYLLLPSHARQEGELMSSVFVIRVGLRTLIFFIMRNRQLVWMGTRDTWIREVCAESRQLLFPESKNWILVIVTALSWVPLHRVNAASEQSILLLPEDILPLSVV